MLGGPNGHIEQTLDNIINDHLYFDVWWHVLRGHSLDSLWDGLRLAHWVPGRWVAVRVAIRVIVCRRGWYWSGGNHFLGCWWAESPVNRWCDHWARGWRRAERTEPWRWCYYWSLSLRWRVNKEIWIFSASWWDTEHSWRIGHPHWWGRRSLLFEYRLLHFNMRDRDWVWNE